MTDQTGNASIALFSLNDHGILTATTAGHPTRTGRPATDEARTNLGSRRRPSCSRPAPQRLPAIRHFRQRWTSPVLPPATRRPTALLLVPAPSANATTMKPGQTSGRCHFHQQTDFGRTAPNLSTIDGPQITVAAAAIAATFGKFGVASSIRRTSPVMTNKGVRNLLEPARNAAVMAPPSADTYPADCPAALPQSLPLHPDILFDPTPNAKNRRAYKALRVSVRVHFSR